MRSEALIHRDPGPAAGLDYLTHLISDRARLREWLDGCDPSLRQPFTHLMLIISALQAVSGLTVPSLLDELRCRRRTPERLRALESRDLEPCVAFLRWVLALALRAPADPCLRRAVVGAASSLYELSGDVDTCRELMGRPLSDRDPMTPEALVEIGEVIPAFRHAEALLVVRFAAAERPSDARAKCAAHISGSTLKALLRYSNWHEERTIGTPHALALLGHLADCRACAEQYVTVATRCGLEPAELEAVGSVP